MHEHGGDEEARFAKRRGVRLGRVPASARKPDGDFKAHWPAANDGSFEISLARALATRFRTLRAWVLWVMLVVLASAAMRSIAQTDSKTPVPPASSASLPDTERFRRIIEGQYPKLMTEKVAGTPVLTVLFDARGRVAGTRLQISSAKPEDLTASVFRFGPLGVSAGDLKNIGSTYIDLPLNRVLVAFARRN